MFPYKKVKGNYEYLNGITDPDIVEAILDLIITFIMSCHRPEHIEADILRRLYAFGLKGFFVDDIEIVKGWCDCLMIVENKLSKHPKIMKMKSGKN